VTFAVTTRAKRNQVDHHIINEPAPGFDVMDLQAFHGTALLAPPATIRYLTTARRDFYRALREFREAKTSS